LFGSFQTIRLIHFLCMSAIVGFLLVHVALALLVPQSLVAMLTGGPVVSDGAMLVAAEAEAKAEAAAEAKVEAEAKAAAKAEAEAEIKVEAEAESEATPSR
jgi:type IV secretory pathway TrbL component